MGQLDLIQELIQKPCEENWWDIVDLFEQWGEQPEKAKALSIAKEGLQTWPASLRIFLKFSPNHEAWELAGGVVYRGESLRTFLATFETHPHLQAIICRTRHIPYEKEDGYGGCDTFFDIFDDGQVFLNQLEKCKTSTLPKNLLELSILYSHAHNMDCLGKLTQLTKLQLVGCSKLRVLPELAALGSLVELNLNYCRSLSNIDGLSRLFSLRILQLNNCEELTKLVALRLLTELQELELMDCPKLISFEGLPKHSQLMRLDIRGSTNPEELDGFENLSQLIDLRRELIPGPLINGQGEPFSPLLRTLSIDSSFYTTENVKKLMGYTQLKKLWVSPCFYLRNIDGLPKSLQVLSLKQCVRLESIEPIAQLRDLRSLCLHSYEERSLKEFWFLPELQHLHTLKLEISGSHAHDLSFLGALTGLRKLSLHYYENITSLNGIETLNQLEELELISCTSLQDVSGLKNFPNLIKLTISDCKKLQTGLEVLPNLPRLHSLAIGEEANQASDKLSQLTSLEELVLGGLEQKEIATITANMRKLTRLSLLSCSIVNLRVLSHLKRLRKLSLSGTGYLSSLYENQEAPPYGSICDGIETLSQLVEINFGSGFYIERLPALLSFPRLSRLGVCQDEAPHYVEELMPYQNFIDNYNSHCQAKMTRSIL